MLFFLSPQYRRLAVPSVFFAAVIFFEEIFLKLYCFHGLTPEGCLFTLLFTLSPALLLGLLCGGTPVRAGRLLLPACTGLVSLWIGTQVVYYHMFKAFLSVFSLTKMAMVAKSFGEMAVGNVLSNWFPILMMLSPTVLAWVFRKALIPAPDPSSTGRRLRWAAMAGGLQLAAMGLVLLCGGGALSLRYIYYHAATPELEVQNFGVCTQTQLELRRVLFGIQPDGPAPEPEPEPDRAPPDLEPTLPDHSLRPGTVPGFHTLPIDFEALADKAEEEELKSAHLWFSQRAPTPENL